MRMLFSRKSRWDRLRDATMHTAMTPAMKQAGKVTAAVAGGAVATTIGSAVVSAARHRSQS
ncbi:MAG TPA: hypothetical protein VMF87_15415 [Streptosporangiaceae bacterium]|nr:hypothetical protein [Streptosporangiaceae bacterium]